MSEKPDQKALDAIKNLDIQKFSPYAYEGVPNLRKKLSNSLFLTRIQWSIGASLATAVGAFLVTSNPNVMIATVMGCAVSGFASMMAQEESLLTKKGYFSTTVVPLYEDLVNARIKELESTIGGIYKLTNCLDSSNIDSETLEKYLNVFQQSQSSKAITDQESYYQILINIKESISKYSAEQKKSQIQASLETLSGS